MLCSSQAITRNYTDFCISPNGDVYYSYAETDFVLMRKRAEVRDLFFGFALFLICLYTGS